MGDTPLALPRSPRWAQAMNSQDAFWREQAQIGKVWQLVCLTTDVEHDGDWKRSILGGRSIFVQRFKDGIRGFENVCSHRGYPLRTEDAGHGPVRCGFHHWQYDKDGRAVGIPKSKEMFGATPRELDIRLQTLEIATCGTLVFARFPNERFTESLEEYLGPGFDILSAMWKDARSPRRRLTEMDANWKLGHHISLDDYHVVAVHPKTFGKNGYLPLDVINYYRFGRHSAFFYGANEAALNEAAAACRAGTYQPDGYRIFQFFPNLVAAHSPVLNSCFLVIQQYIPVAHDRTTVLTLIHESPFARSPGRRHELIRRAIGPALPRMISLGTNRILRQDNAVCENMQSIADQLTRPQVLGRQEERIGWFEENYADVVGDLRTE